MSSTALDALFDEQVDTPEEIQESEDTLEEEVSDDLQEEIPQDDTPAEEIPDEIERISLNDFASDVEVEMEDVYELSVNMPFEMEAKTINELKDFMVANADIDEVRQQVEQQKQDLEVQREAQRADPLITKEVSDAIAHRQALEMRRNSVDWQSIRQNQPSEWTAMQMEFTNAINDADANVARTQQAAKEHQEQQRQWQTERLFEKRPDLKDEETRVKTSASVKKMLSRFNLSSMMSDIDNADVMDMLIHFSTMDKAAETVKPKMVQKTPPKKAKAAPVTPSTKKAKLAKLYKRAQEGGKKELDAYYEAALS